MKMFRLLSIFLLLSGGAGAALAEVPLDGKFRAAQACPAYVSIRKETNPGAVMTEPGQDYRLLAGNRDRPSHYRIEIPGAEPPERWVAVECGARGGEAAPPKAGRAAKGPSFVLAISWQPAFCEGSPGKRECRTQTASRFDATHFTLHGLWPQPGANVYCGVSAADRAASADSRWRDLPRVSLTPATKAALEKVMPGTQSFLERHEWTKHGTCYPVREAETYYRDSLRLLGAVNASPVRALMESRIGREVSAREIRARFDEAFGKGAGERVRIACRDAGGRRLIAELTLGLKGDIPGGTPLGDLLLSSPPTDPGCPGGEVDPAGR